MCQMGAERPQWRVWFRAAVSKFMLDASSPLQVKISKRLPFWSSISSKVRIRVLS